EKSDANLDVDLDAKPKKTKKTKSRSKRKKNKLPQNTDKKSENHDDSNKNNDSDEDNFTTKLPTDIADYDTDDMEYVLEKNKTKHDEVSVDESEQADPVFQAAV